MPYGFDRTLEDGDLIALAGTAAFKFSLLKPPILPMFIANRPDALRPSPHGAWGLLIDGRQKTIKDLTDSTYEISNGDTGAVQLNDSKGAPVMIIHRGHAGGYGITLVKSDSDRHLLIQAKINDYNYPICQIDRSIEAQKDVCSFFARQAELDTENAMVMTTVCYGRWNEHLGADGALPQFSMLPYSREENPSNGGVECDLGPFQIVPVNTPEPLESAGQSLPVK
ncbi:MAG: hypothetical protein WBW81_03725 [Methylocella sp.]